MAAAVDAFVELPMNEWQNLKEFLKTHWPSSIHAYYLLEYQERWINNGCDVTKVYLPYGNRDNGIVIVSILTDILYSVTIFTAKDNIQTLVKSLLSTKTIDWSRRHGVMMACVCDFLKNSILDVFQSLDMKVMTETHSCGFFKTNEEAVKSNFECPEEVYIATLTKTNAIQMNEVWPHKFPGSEEFFFKLIENNGGYGLFTRSNNEMVAWVTQSDFGSLGNLFCTEEHRGKGYAQLLTRVMERKLVQNGEDVYSFVVRKNLKSMNLFKKMGYGIFAENVFWLHAMKNEHARSIGSIFK